MPKDTPKKPNRNLWTTLGITKSNLRLAQRLCPEIEGIKPVFKYWFNQWLKEQLTKALEEKKAAETA